MNPHPSRQLRAFTLIELLTVIAIIAILMGLLFPAIGIVKDQANKTRARTDVTNIVAAIKQYNVEYGKYPVIQAPTSSPTDSGKDLLCGSPRAVSGGATAIKNSDLFNTLRGIAAGINSSAGYTGVDHGLNPRRIGFFEAKVASNPDAPKGGFLDKPGSGNADDKGCFFDPWGEQYNIIIDQNYDGLLNNPPMPYNDFATPNEPRTGVGAFSLGKDNKVGNNGDKIFKNGTTVSDDIISWQQ